MTTVQLSDATRLSIPDHVLSREAGDETVLLNLDSEEYFGLEDVGSRLWALLEQGTTFLDARVELLSAYDVDEDVLDADLRALIATLADKGLVAIDDPS